MTCCTDCTYYNKIALEGPAEKLPHPCIVCDGGSHWIERGKRPKPPTYKDLVTANGLLREQNAAQAARIAELEALAKKAIRCVGVAGGLRHESLLAEAKRLGVG